MKVRYVLNEKTGKLVPAKALNVRKVDAWSGGKLSTAMAVNPKDAPAWERFYAENGVPTKHAPDGRPIVRTRDQQNRMLALRGEFNMDAGYGDRTIGDTRWPCRE